MLASLLWLLRHLKCIYSCLIHWHSRRSKRFSCRRSCWTPLRNAAAELKFLGCCLFQLPLHMLSPWSIQHIPLSYLSRVVRWLGRSSHTSTNVSSNFSIGWQVSFPAFDLFSDTRLLSMAMAPSLLLFRMFSCTLQ